MNIKERIEALRGSMKKKGVSAYVVPSADFHGSEYVADFFKARAWISGFQGSAGTVVVTLEDAGLWTDGRYYIQAEAELKGSGVRLFKAADPGVPSYTDWLKDNLPENSTVGFDGRVIFVNEYKNMLSIFLGKNIKIKIDEDLIDEVWKDRPAIPKTEVFLHDIKFTGKSRCEKIKEVLCEMEKQSADYYLLSSLDDIAWLLNIRGRDVSFNPVTISHVIISKEKCTLFIDNSKLTVAVKNELINDGIEIREYDEIEKCLKLIPENKSVFFDPAKTNSLLYAAVCKHKIVEGTNITTHFKGAKNPIELENIRRSHIRDGAAVVRFINWLKKNVGKEEITEIMTEDKVAEFRAEMEYFVEPSFNTIAGYKEHAAMMHFKAQKDTQYTLKPEGMLLVDSGGQYFDGTTDMTRTIVLGPLTPEERNDYTLVVRGMINLAIARFIYGATGSNLDVIPRRLFWEQGIDYKCGTGHGVGYFLNVHEGPHRISTIPNAIRLEKGMLITDEPGVYKVGKHGIRVENILVVEEDEVTEYGGQFMKFETITFCPIDLDGIIPELLTAEERNWLNNYHKQVYEKLLPYLHGDDREFLKTATREI